MTFTSTTFYPAPDPNDSTNKVEWTPLLPLQRGEYDLVNISLIGHDPNTGWSYDKCNAAWSEALLATQTELKALKWWQFRKRRALAPKIAALVQRQGLMF